MFKIFVKSAKEFTNVKSLVTAALLLALHTVLACFVSIQVTPTLRISVSFITNCITGYLFGPIMGLVCGGLGDIIQFVIRPVGPYFYGWTLNACAAGFIYGCFFYKRSPKTLPVLKEKNKDVSDSEKKRFTIIDAASFLIAGLQITSVLCTNIIKYNGEAYNGIQTLGRTITGKAGTAMLVETILLLVGAAFIIISTMTKWYPVSMVISIITCFIPWLSVYTDKKTSSISTGFYLYIALTLIYVFIHMAVLLKNHSVDIKFLLLTIVGLTVDTVLVNIIMGTYWCSIMYGKGFYFYLVSRTVKNLIQLPVNIALVYYILGFMKNVKKYFE